MAVIFLNRGPGVEGPMFRTACETVIWDINVAEASSGMMYSPEFNVEEMLCSMSLQIQADVVMVSIVKISEISSKRYIGFNLVFLSDRPGFIFGCFHEGWDFSICSPCLSFDNVKCLKSIRNQEVVRIVGTFYKIDAASEFAPVYISPQEMDITKDLKSLSDDMKKVFMKHKDSDFTIRMPGKEFHVHKAILSARSSYFTAMLSSGMKEQATNSADISDCEEEVFEQFLLFLYSNQVKDLTYSRAIQLYILADKYDSGDLRRFCVNFLQKTVCPCSFCDILSLALKYDIEPLKSTAERVFLKQAEAILRTDEWASLMKENPVATNELFAKYAQRYDPQARSAFSRLLRRIKRRL